MVAMKEAIRPWCRARCRDWANRAGPSALALRWRRSCRRWKCKYTRHICAHLAAAPVSKPTEDAFTLPFGHPAASLVHVNTCPTPIAPDKYAAAAIPVPPRSRSLRLARGLRLTSPASWASFRSPRAHRKMLCTQVSERGGQTHYNMSDDT